MSCGCEKCEAFASAPSRAHNVASGSRGAKGGRGQVRNRLEVVHSTPAEQSRHLDRVFHGVDHHLGLTIGHHGMM